VLPSFGQFVVTFLGGFLLVFGGVHLVATSRIAQESLSVLPADAAPLQIAGSGIPDRRRLDMPLPAMFDVRFAMDAASNAPIPASLTQHAIDRVSTRVPQTIRETFQQRFEIMSAPPAAPIATPNSLPAEPTSTSAPPEATPIGTATLDRKIEIAALPAPNAMPTEPDAELPYIPGSLEPESVAPPAIAPAQSPKPLISRARRGKRPTAQAPTPTQPRKVRTRRSSAAEPANTTSTPSPPATPFGGDAAQ
jgi:hypothetical protein